MTARVFWRDLVRDAQFILKTEGSAEVARICRANLVAVHIYQAGQREAFLRHCQREIEEATPAPTYFCLITQDPEFGRLVASLLQREKLLKAASELLEANQLSAKAVLRVAGFKIES